MQLLGQNALLMSEVKGQSGLNNRNAAAIKIIVLCNNSLRNECTSPLSRVHVYY